MIPLVRVCCVGAVAVVDVEINNRHTGEAMFGAGVFGADSDAVEQAKPHGFGLFRMMPWRANGAKCVIRSAC